MSFNQPVGTTMRRSLGEVSKFIVLTHDGWPRGRKIEFSFEEKYVPKDGPSASVACALLLDSLITGQDIKTDFAVTGDMNADGSIQPIGGCAAKLRGATKGGAKIVMFPKDNEAQLQDLIISEGMIPFVKIQVLTGDTFKDAQNVAITRTPEIEAALSSFKQIQQLYDKDPSAFGRYLKNPKVIAKIREVGQAMPNHLSAKYLLLASSGRLPEQLSLMGSMLAIEDAASALIDATSSSGEEFSSLEPDYLAQAVGGLRKIRNQLDPRSRKYSDAIVDFGVLIKDLKKNPPQTINARDSWIEKINAAGARIGQEVKQIQIDEEAMEELL